MATKNSKNKGSTFERNICKRLSEWWTEGESDSIFWRTASSGGRATQRAKKGKATTGQGGDIAAISPIGEPLIKFISFELKKGYPSFEIARILDREEKSKPSIFEEWIEQAVKSMEDSEAYSWAIIAQKDRKRSIIIMPLPDFEWAWGYTINGITNPTITNPTIFKDCPPVIEIKNVFTDPDTGSKESLICLRLDDFFNLIKPKFVREQMKNYEKKT